MNKMKIKQIILIISLVLISSNVVLGMEVNPSKGSPVFLADPDQPNTYTSTIRNPVRVKAYGGTITEISNPVWEAQPFLTYTTTSMILQPGCYDYYYATYTASTEYQNILEYIVVTRGTNKPMDYASINGYINVDSYEEPNRLVLGAEITPAYPQNMIKPPIPISFGKRIKILIYNKSQDVQLFNIGIIVSQRRITPY